MPLNTHHIIGIMSGTSLDGVDLAHCTFTDSGDTINFKIGACETIPYPADWLWRLQSLPTSTAYEYALTHVEYGRYVGELVREFTLRSQLKTDFVASHGHTIFHNPAKGFTSQIGEGSAIAAACNLPVICDFRSGDVACGGQGAPLVPIGDQLLFPGYDYCLNLGGFANISMTKDGHRIAYDISPANIILNYLASKLGKPYDAQGEMASSGKISIELLSELNKAAYFTSPPPKSLGREWIETEVLPLLDSFSASYYDVLCTYCEHIAVQISLCLSGGSEKKMLITGGGAFNSFLVKRISAHTKVRIVIPEAEIVNYKEALIFALLGLLRLQNKPNCLASVTGANRDISGGAMYLP